MSLSICRIFFFESEVDDPEEFMRTGIWEGESRPFNGLQEFVADPQVSPCNTFGRIELVSQLCGAAAVPHCQNRLCHHGIRCGLITPTKVPVFRSQHTNVEKLSRLCDDRVCLCIR